MHYGLGYYAGLNDGYYGGVVVVQVVGIDRSTHTGLKGAWFQTVKIRN